MSGEEAQSLHAPSSLRDAFLAVPELEKVTAGFGMLVPFYHRSKTLFVMFLSFRSCAVGRVSSAFGLERWKVCPASVTRLLPRVILEDPELGSSSPSTVEAEQKTESFGLRHQKSLRTVTFSRGFILGYPRKAVMLVIGVSKLPSMCRHHDDGV